MGDFSFHSNTSKSAVDQILAEAMDHCVLQQIAAINCSSFSNSVLPSHLESRFQKLKTFPSSSSSSSSSSSAKEFNNSAHSPKTEKPTSDSTLKRSETNSTGKSGSGYHSSPSGSSNSSSGYLNSPKIKAKESDRKCKDENFPSKSPSFRSNSSTKVVDTGCFWCSPKRVSKKKSATPKEVFELSDDWGKHDEILSDLKSFSSKHQKKMMKIAKKEEDKINKEAEKIVKWAKQTSARLDFSIDDDDLSDDDHFGLH